MDGKTCWFADEQNQIVTDGRNSWSLEVEDLREELSRRMSMIEDLEEWKEKARPFLEKELKKLKRYQDFDLDLGKSIPSCVTAINKLTELLGGDDDR